MLGAQMKRPPQGAAFSLHRKRCLFGGSCRDRTYDQWIKSPLLYQLS